ncbi:Protein epidermal patterning factor 2 [Apostasia shenzhenica]|uniref:Epidermal patterning factor-like protein n=1 Tax=Apostasia shenzhenica TaxID=1088818 RepID=A0A2H9ZUZ0_9ASPA|nr:Protein epidermal patterning factor 2 [Apostasia shenzhenica]
MMKPHFRIWFWIRPLITAVILLLIVSIAGRTPMKKEQLRYLLSTPSKMIKEEDEDQLIVGKLDGTGSSLPDCSHACGPCSPCKRVTVSFKCSVAESCPIVYRCMCNGRFYHVPSE